MARFRELGDACTGAKPSERERRQAFDRSSPAFASCRGDPRECNLSPPSLGRGGLFFVTRRLVNGEARSIGSDGPQRSFVRVRDLGTKDKLGLLRQVFGAAHDSVDPGKRERVDLIAQGWSIEPGSVSNSFILIGLFAAVRSQPLT